MALESECMRNLELVELWPKGILLHGKFNKIYKRKFAIYNPSLMEVAFKIADTLPDNMVIEPDHGYIRAKSLIKIMMRVLPFGENSFSETEKITVFLCPAPSIKQVNIWSGGDSWPDGSCYAQMVVKFVEFDEECESSSWSTSSSSSSDESSSMGLKPGGEFEPRSGVESESDTEEPNACNSKKLDQI